MEHQYGTHRAQTSTADAEPDTSTNTRHNYSAQQLQNVAGIPTV